MDLKEYASKEPSGKQMGEQDVREAIGHYSKLNNDQLMAELVKQLATKREKGEMASVRETIEKIKPFLSAEQKNRLETITSQLNI